MDHKQYDAATDKKLYICEIEENQDSNGEVNFTKAPVEYVNVAKSEPLMNECQHFIDCIRSNKQPITNAVEGFEVMKVLDKCMMERQIQQFNSSNVSSHKDLSIE